VIAGTVTGGFPTARFGHRAVLLETQVVVFGGYNGAHKRRAEGQKGLDDNLIALDSRTLEWWKPSSEGFAPGLRYVDVNEFCMFTTVQAITVCARADTDTP